MSLRGANRVQATQKNENVEPLKKTPKNCSPAKCRAITQVGFTCLLLESVPCPTGKSDGCATASVTDDASSESTTHHYVVSPRGRPERLVCDVRKDCSVFA